MLLGATLAIAPMHLSASENLLLFDIRSMGLAQISSPIDSYVNPAALSLNPHHAFNLSYRNSYYLKELSTATGVYQRPQKWVDLSLLVNYFGYDEYNELQCGVNVSKLLNSEISLGIRLRYNRLNSIGYQTNYHSILGDIGIQYRPVDNLSIGLLLANPFSTSINSEENSFRYPVTLALGMELHLSSNTNLLVEIQKSEKHQFCLKAAIEYYLIETIALRVGFITSPALPTFGIGYRLNSWRFDIAGSYHSLLGFSSSIGLQFTL